MKATKLTAATARWTKHWSSVLAMAALLCCLAQPSAAADKPPIRIGAVLPFSGGVEVYGNQAKLGLDLAAKEINAAGGILGRPVELIYEDDRTNPEFAERAVRKLIEQDGVLAVVGPITSRNLIAIQPTVASLKTPLLYATNYEGGACGRYVFAFSTVPNQELAPLLPYMNEHFGNTYYLLGADRAWPHKMFDAAEPLIAKLGGQVVGKEYASGTETDFTPLIKRIADSKAKVLLFALKGDGLNFIMQAHDQGLWQKVTVAFLGLSEADFAVFGDKGPNMHVIVPFVATSGIPAVKAFVARARTLAGPDATVSNYVMTHYDALMAVKAALRKAGKVDKEALVDALEGLTIASPAGKVTLGKDHHATMNVYLAKSTARDLVTVRALGAIAPASGCR